MIQSILMKKDKAIELLGGSISAAASAVGVSYQAVNQWPDELPRRIEDRVYAALYRMQNPTQDRPVDGDNKTSEVATASP